MKKQVTVVIPIHLEEPSELEKVSLTQTLAVLNKHPITFQAKQGLNTHWYEEFCKGKADVRFERFKWNGFREYTELMMSPKFYGRFLDYEYILICHLDAFVFRDELDKWCAHGYDYVGSVIYNNAWANLPSKFGRLLGLSVPEYYSNGGFGLRRVETFYNMSSYFPWRIKFYLWYKTVRKKFFQDDIFLSQLYPKLASHFRVPPKAVAEKFGAAYENWKEEDLPFSRNDCANLPFGTHGWFSHYPEFWKACIRQHGYDI
jgi:Protein of unknown function (DUF5672)